MGTQDHKNRNLPFVDGSLKCIPGSVAGQQFFQQDFSLRSRLGHPERIPLQDVYYQIDRGIYWPRAILVGFAECEIRGPISNSIASVHQSGYLAQPNRGLSRDERGARPDRRELAGQVGQFRTSAAAFWKPVFALRRLRPGGKHPQATERGTERRPRRFANRNSRLNRALKFSEVFRYVEELPLIESMMLSAQY